MLGVHKEIELIGSYAPKAHFRRYVVMKLIPNLQCPTCSNDVERRDREKAIGWHFRRKTISCPNCGASLILRLEPIRLMVAGVIGACLSGGIYCSFPLASCLFGSTVDPPEWRQWLVAPFAIFVIIALSGVYKLQFQEDQSEET